MKINLLSSPRNRSTLLMYAFAQRSDTQVSDEPFYASFLQTSGIQHPGRNAVLSSQAIDRKTVQNNLLASNAPILFIKNMAHHYFPENFNELLKFKNILYIRNPRAIIRSYARVIDKPIASDIGIHKVKDIYKYLISKKHTPIIFDSDDLITNPKKALKSLCQKLDIDFSEAMLNWQAGPKTYDGIWAKYWYASVHASTGFIANPNANLEKILLAPHLEDLAQECLPVYKELKLYAKQ